MANISSEEKRSECKACRHPRGPARNMTVASTNWGELRQGANSGCLTCLIFSSVIQTLVTKETGKSEPDLNLRVVLKFNMSTMGDSLSMFIFQPEMRISFYATKYTPWLQQTLPDLPLGRSVPHGTSSNESIDWARTQIQHCRSSHVACQPASETTPPMPRRILDIGVSETDQVRLFEPSDLREPYACLSYCWGRTGFLATKSTTIESHSINIPWGSLPLTFQNAVSFLRKLAIQFLWVDSLCIIQDDLNDWQREAAQMSSIYQNAYLVVSATKSSNTNEGLFTDLDPRFRSHSLSVTTPEGYIEEICYRHSLTHLPGPLDHSPPNSTSLPTLTRGWIYQERLLATRVLHFGPQELMWECLEHATCQCTDSSRPSTILSSLVRSTSWGGKMLQLKHDFKLQYWNSWDERQLGRCWHQLIEEYTKLNLTHEMDIFPAFSGVASRFQAACESKFLAGLWEKSLLRDILWHVETHSEAQKAKFVSGGRPTTWRAPSWSWASVCLPVSFIDTSLGLDPCCSVKEAICEVDGINPTGKVKDGYVILQGNIIPMVLKYSDHGPNEIQSWNLYRLDKMEGRVHNLWADSNTTALGDGYLPSGTEVYCFPVGTRKISGAIECLLLKKVRVQEDTTSVLYERAGLLEIPRAPLDGLDEWLTLSNRTRIVKII